MGQQGANTQTQRAFDTSAIPDKAQQDADTEAVAKAYAAKRKRSQKALKQMMRPVSGHLLVARLLTVVSAVLGVAPYVALTWIGTLLVDSYKSGNPVDQAALWTDAGWLVAAFLGQVVFYTLALVVTHFADLKLRAVMQRDIIDRISRAPLSWFSESASGAVRKAVQDDTVSIHMLVAHAPVEQTAAIVAPILLLIYAFTIDWRLALLAIVTLPVFALLQANMMRGMGTKTAEMDQRLAKVSATAVEFSDGISVVKAFGRTGKAHSRFISSVHEFTRFYWAWVGPLIRGSSISMLVISTPVVLLISLGGGLAMAQAGWVGIPQVLTCALIALVIPQTFETIGMAAWAYQQAGDAALRIWNILNIDQLAPGQGSDVPVVAGDIRYEDVSYAYSNNGEKVQALDHVSLTMPRGSLTALIGPSGSGKSTFATLLARFRDPDQGTITIGGRDLRDIPEQQLYRAVSFVLQDTHLLRVSVRDNITLARPDATDDEVEGAARAANIWDDIQALPRGLDTIVGQDTDLSGGQKQRIAIARAILADAPILILDEATASTDPDCEAEIQQALSALVKGRTVLVIAHHAETVAGADQIVVMRGAKIEAVGTAAQIADNPFWQRLKGQAND